jgi:hypothetical protein
MLLRGLSSANIFSNRSLLVPCFNTSRFLKKRHKKLTLAS